MSENVPKQECEIRGTFGFSGTEYDMFLAYVL